MSNKIKKNIKSDSNLLADLGDQPVSNRFLPFNSIAEVPRFSFKLCSDKKTGLVYLENPFPVTELKPRYEWITCYEPEDHLDRLVEKLIKLPGVNKSSVFGAYSLEIFLVSLVFWVPLTILMIKFLIGKDYSPALRQLRLYFLVMGGTFTVSLLLTFPQVRHRVAFAEVFYWLFAVIVLDRYLSRKKTKSPS